MADWKEAVLADFAAWLAQLDDVALATGEPAAGEVPVPLAGSDLHAVYSELASLRQEVRLQNREQARALRLAERDREGQQEAMQRSAERDCLTPMLEVRDALVRGREGVGSVARARRWRRPRGIEDVARGYDMALERFDRALAAVGVTPVATVGEPFNARTMLSVQALADSGSQEGTVIEELRSGFAHANGAVLRLAEVVVNRPNQKLKEVAGA